MSSAWLRRACAVTKVLAAAGLLAVAPAPAGAAAHVARPQVDSLEYKRSWGLQAIGAETAYEAGFTGRGVRIALIDCGLKQAQRELKRNVSRESVDLVTPRLTPIADRHATLVADPLGAALNGRGMVGVAYNATLLEIRADMDGGFNGECAFWPRDIARGLDYAVAHSARIVVLPVQAEHRLGATFEAALGRAVDQGVVVVVAAGNGESDEPAWPARYAADPRYARGMVVAGALGWNGELASWSNRAGDAQDRYVAAPGQWIITDCGMRKCEIVSGTSFSTPYVAGAVALMMEAHPELSGPQAAERVLAAARDGGAPGVDAVYGRGVLDLGRAFGPAAGAGD